MATGITQTDVWHAADALLHEGARPTIERVRLKMGRGSPNTVGPHLDSWFRGLGPRLNGGKSGASADIGETPDPVAQAAAGMWSIAMQAARAALEQEAQAGRAALALAREQLESEAAAVHEHAERLARREHDLQETVALLKSQLHATQARARAMDEERERMLAQLAELAGQHRETLQANERLTRQRDDERKTHADERAREDERSRAQEKRWLSELDLAREAARRLQQQHDRLQKTSEARAAALQQTLAQQRTSLQDLQVEATRLQAAVAAGNEMAQSQQREVDRLQAELARARQHEKDRAAAQRAREESWARQVEAHHVALARIQERVTQLQEQLRQALEAGRQKDAALQAAEAARRP